MKAGLIIFFIGLLLNFSPGSVFALPGESSMEKADTFDLLKEVLVRHSKENGVGIGDMRKFLAISVKFSRRPHLMTKEVLSAVYRHYDDYNVLVEFIEKIPIREPETVLRLFIWVKNFEKLHPQNKRLLTPIFQSLLELFAHAARYAPDRYDYDKLINQLIAIPWGPADFYDKLFDFFETGLNIRLNKKNFVDFVLEGINNRTLNINNTDFTFTIKDQYRREIEEILQGQQVCSLSTLLGINQQLDRLTEGDSFSPSAAVSRRILQLFEKLPYAEISKDAPASIQERVVVYSKEAFNKDVTDLIEKISTGAQAPELRSLILEIKNNYLLHHLKDHLLALVYAVNAKSAKLRVFVNPNMVRLHDFDDYKERTPWNYCGIPPAGSHFSGYHLSGGLSRLNTAFAVKWYEHLFRQTFIYNPSHVQAMLVNLLDLYPVPAVNQNIEYNALLVDFGLDLLRNARENETLRNHVIKELGTITSGYHYRKTVNYLNGKAKDYRLFFSEIKNLGEALFNKGKYLETPTGKELLKKRARPSGSIYYHTFGNLTPQSFRMFPQDVSNLFDSGRISGEIIDEFKIKVGWFLYKQKLPGILMGQVLYSYLTGTAPRYFSQSHANDYISTYFMFEVFNKSHLNRILKNLQKQGYLKLK